MYAGVDSQMNGDMPHDGGHGGGGGGGHAVGEELTKTGRYRAVDEPLKRQSSHIKILCSGVLFFINKAALQCLTLQ